MDQRKMIALVVGVLMVLLGLFADNLGIGADQGIGYKQISLTLVGTAVLAAGYFLGSKS